LPFWKILVRKLLPLLWRAMKLGQQRRPRTAFRRVAERAFTLTEILIASAVIIVVGATATFALTMINKYAISARVQAAAQSIVMNQIDQILTRGPYVPTNIPPDVPAILKSAKTETNTPIFTDPESGSVVVTGKLTTEIQDSGASSNGTPLNVLRAKVTLDYTFAGRPLTVVMNTLRAPDQ
jgi:type II secretory pathway pseudopilin PulG